jgi:hypothetical protein
MAEFTTGQIVYYESSGGKRVKAEVPSSSQNLGKILADAFDVRCSVDG